MRRYAPERALCAIGQDERVLRRHMALDPADLAFLAAPAHQQLGHTKEAAAGLPLPTGADEGSAPDAKDGRGPGASCAKRQRIATAKTQAAEQQMKASVEGWCDERRKQSSQPHVRRQAPGERAALPGRSATQQAMSSSAAASSGCSRPDGQAADIVERGPDAGPTDAPAPDGPPLLPERVFAGRFRSSARSSAKGAWARSGSPTRPRPCSAPSPSRLSAPGLDSERMLARFDQERQGVGHRLSWTIPTSPRSWMPARPTAAPTS